MHETDARAHWLAVNVLPHEPALRTWLAGKQVHGLDVDDIVQETYARLSMLADVDQIRDPRSYTFRTAYSIIVSHVRHSRVVPMHSFAQFEMDTFVQDQPDPEDIAIARDELAKLYRAVADLPPRMRQVFVLRRVQGLSQREVAARLGVSESTIEKQMSEGLLRLSRIFGRGGTRTTDASKAETERRGEANGTRD